MTSGRSDVTSISPWPAVVSGSLSVIRVGWVLDPLECTSNRTESISIYVNGLVSLTGLIKTPAEPINSRRSMFCWSAQNWMTQRYRPCSARLGLGGLIAWAR